MHLRESGFRKPHTHTYHHTKAQKRSARAELLWIRIQLIHDFHVFSKFGQNHIFGLYGKTRYFKQLHLIQNVLRHSKTTFPWLSSHVV